MAVRRGSLLLSYNTIIILSLFSSIRQGGALPIYLLSIHLKKYAYIGISTCSLGESLSDPTISTRRKIYWVPAVIRFLVFFFLFLARIAFQSLFFSESRSFTWPLFCFFVPDLDWLAGQLIQIFFVFSLCFRSGSRFFP